MKFVCISDTHSKHRQLELPQGDVLLHAGDFCFARKGNHHEEMRHSKERVGCTAQRRMLDVRKEQDPVKLVVCGHIHSGYGRWEDGPTQVVNASVVNEQYHVAYKPVVVELTKEI